MSNQIINNDLTPLDFTSTGDWFYMNEHEVPIRSLYDALNKVTTLELEFWEVAGIIELSLTEKASLDIEFACPSFKDPEGNAFLKSNHIQSLYMVTFQKELISIVLPLMKSIVSICGGFFCADTLDFTPRIS